MKDWYRNMATGQKRFVWGVSAAMLVVYLVGLIPLAVLTYLELGQREEGV